MGWILRSIQVQKLIKSNPITKKINKTKPITKKNNQVKTIKALPITPDTN